MMNFIKPTYGITVVFFLTCIHVALSQVSTDGEWKTNCFRETDSGRCEESWIKISSSYYTCDMVIELEAPPKRIGYVNGNILAAIGSKTYFVHNETLKPVTARRLIPPWDEFVDEKDNRYYAAEGTTYMADSETKKEIEILTTGEYSVNQLALDKELNRLLILSFSSQTQSNERAGSLFAINTDTIDVANDNVQAEKVDQTGDSITAMAVEGNIENLLLGRRTSHGGKLLRLKKQNSNPCSENDVGKSAIVDIIREAQDKLLKVFKEISAHSSPQQRGNLMHRSAADISPRTLEMENTRLKRELFITSTKLNSFTAKLLSFNSHIKSVEMQIPTTTPASPIYFISGGPPGPPGHPGSLGPPPPLRPSGRSGPTGPLYTKDFQGRVKSEDTEPTTSPKTERLEESEEESSQCVPIDMYYKMSQKVKNTERINEELRKKLEELSLGVDNILSER